MRIFTLFWSFWQQSQHFAENIGGKSYFQNIKHCKGGQWAYCSFFAPISLASSFDIDSYMHLLTKHFIHLCIHCTHSLPRQIDITNKLDAYVISAMHFQFFFNFFLCSIFLYFFFHKCANIWSDVRIKMKREHNKLMTEPNILMYFQYQFGQRKIFNSIRSAESTKYAKIKSHSAMLLKEKPAHQKNNHAAWWGNGTEHLSEIELIPPYVTRFKCDNGAWGLFWNSKNHKWIKLKGIFINTVLKDCQPSISL